MPAKPRTAQKAAAALQVAGKQPASTRPRSKPRPAADGVLQWDTYVAEVEATASDNPWRIALPDGDVLEVGCPTSEQVDELGLAQAQGDVQKMFEVVFGEEHADTLLNLTAKLPFTSRVRLVNDVMVHHGMGGLAQLPESDASSS